jgi:hypothetical protein
VFFFLYQSLLATFHHAGDHLGLVHRDLISEFRDVLLEELFERDCCVVLKHRFFKMFLFFSLSKADSNSFWNGKVRRNELGLKEDTFHHDVKLTLAVEVNAGVFDFINFIREIERVFSRFLAHSLARIHPELFYLLTHFLI